MHFHYVSFLLGILCGIVLVCLLIYLAYKMVMKTDEDLFRMQRSLDNYPEEFKKSQE